MQTQQKHPSVVVIGGGTGTYTILSGLREKPVHATALLTMVDDGGSNKVLRDEFGLLPTSGVRLAMVALSSQQSLLRELFTYRFHQGTGITGMTFGNLFLAAVADITGSQKRAIAETSKLLSVQGDVLPISYDDVRLVATYSDGHDVVGEHLIDEPEHDGTLRIVAMKTVPMAKIDDDAKQAILDADLVILGPGDFYTNTVANLVIGGVVDALMHTKAKVIFVMNLISKYGEAYNYKASDYIQDLGQYMPLERLNGILINSDMAYPQAALDKYVTERSIPVEDDLNTLDLPHVVIKREPIVSSEVIETQAGDRVKRSMIRHDAEKLSEAVLSFLE